MRQLSAAQATSAKVEGDTIGAGSEFAAIQFIAAATGANVEMVAHVAIMTIAAIPDVLAVLLLLAAGDATTKKTSARCAVRRRKATRRPQRSARVLKVA